MHEGFTWIDTVVLVLYLVGVLLAGLYFSKKEMKGKEFFKGDVTPTRLAYSNALSISCSVFM